MTDRLQRLEDFASLAMFVSMIETMLEENPSLAPDLLVFINLTSRQRAELLLLVPLAKVDLDKMATVLKLQDTDGRRLLFEAFTEAPDAVATARTERQYRSKSLEDAIWLFNGHTHSSGPQMEKAALRYMVKFFLKE
jgi:hypothetical protein